MSKKIILIAGPTASGKSKIAIEIANKIKGEIINADSMQVYKDFSVLSSRPSSSDLKKTKTGIKEKDSEIETLNIKVRNITAKDIKDRKLNKNLKGVIITSISNKSVVAGMLREGDIIIEVQKNKVLNSRQLNQLIESIYKKGEQTLLLTIINSDNQRRYLGVKTN